MESNIYYTLLAPVVVAIIIIIIMLIGFFYFGYLLLNSENMQDKIVNANVILQNSNPEHIDIIAYFQGGTSLMKRLYYINNNTYMTHTIFQQPKNGDMTYDTRNKLLEVTLNGKTYKYKLTK